ncbi:MAG TPA: DUF5700 domain-containing putative Zn-dependent protease [bacterium]|nr:DUF5700 domain-containing putative Zn-dependent protease [bacterium]
MAFKRTILVFLVLVLFMSCTQKDQFNFNSKWEWQELHTFSKDTTTRKQIDQLQKTLPLDEARFIFKQLDKLEKPGQIQKLSTLEKKQKEWGGSFYGFIPDHFKDSTKIPIPNNFKNTIATAHHLAKIRNNNYKVLSRGELRYNIKFKNKDDDLPQEEIQPLNSNLELDIDISAIDDVLDYYKKKSPTLDEAFKIAQHPVFRAMLKHRRNLGYIPEPLPDSTDLGKFIYSAANPKPINRIWNWLNPCNFFCFSDIYTNQDKFRKYIKYLDNNSEQLEYNILKRIDRFVPDNTKFSDKISFGVNFGIRSWATSNSVGTNIAQVKDRFPTLLRTMRHEVFHHVQLAICPVSSDIKNRDNLDFSDLTTWNFQNKNDRKFYRVLSYIFLEGTATYVGGKPENWRFFEEVKKSIGMLDQIYSSIYTNKNPEMTEKIINMGLKSNGPFYGLGYFMARTIKIQYGEEELQKAIVKGPLYFFKKFHEYRLSKSTRKFTHITDRVGKKIDELYSKAEI